MVRTFPAFGRQVASRCQALLPDLPYKHGRGEGPGTTGLRHRSRGPPFRGCGPSSSNAITHLAYHWPKTSLYNSAEPGGVVRYRALETHLFWKVVSFCSSSSSKYKHQFEELLLKVDCCLWGFGDGHWLSARLTTLSLFPRLLPKPCLFRSRFFPNVFLLPV